MRRTQEGFVPFKDDKTKDTENTDFEAGSNNTPMATLDKTHITVRPVFCRERIYPFRLGAVIQTFT